jgi:hypothetical protein
MFPMVIVTRSRYMPVTLSGKDNGFVLCAIMDTMMTFLLVTIKTYFTCLFALLVDFFPTCLPELSI